MKQTYHLFLCLLIGYIYYEGFNYVGLPYWGHLLTIPLLFYFLLFGTNLYSFRISLDFEDIPARGYQSRVSDLNRNQTTLHELGFRKFDEFYWRISTDAVVYAYINEDQTIVLCDYHLGVVRGCDLVTNFENGVSLTTSNIAGSGNLPRPEKKLLQIFPESPFGEVLRNHGQAIEFLEGRGFGLERWQQKDFRIEFMKAYLGVRDQTVGLLSPVKLLFWMMSGYKTRHMHPIERQFATKTLELP